MDDFNKGYREGLRVSSQIAAEHMEEYENLSSPDGFEQGACSACQIIKEEIDELNVPERLQDD